MSRLLACFTVLALVSGGSLAALSTNVPPQAVLQSGLPALSGEWSAMTPAQPFAEEAVTEVIQVAGRFNRGASRNANRSGRVGGRGGGVHNNVNRNRNVNVNANRNVNVNASGYRRGGVVVVDDYDDDSNEVGAAIVGGLIGVGVGAAIANSNQPSNSCSGSNCGY